MWTYAHKRTELTYSYLGLIINDLKLPNLFCLIILHCIL